MVMIHGETNPASFRLVADGTKTHLALKHGIIVGLTKIESLEAGFPCMILALFFHLRGGQACFSARLTVSTFTVLRCLGVVKAFQSLHFATPTALLARKGHTFFHESMISDLSSCALHSGMPE